MAADILTFGRPKAVEAAHPPPRPPRLDFFASSVKGLWYTNIMVQEADIERVGELAKAEFDTAPDDLSLVVSFTKQVLLTEDFGVFHRLFMELLNNVINDVVYAQPGGDSGTLPDETTNVMRDELCGFLIRVKHFCSMDTYHQPNGFLLAQISINSFGMMVNFVYGKDGTVYDQSNLMTFAFLLKEVD